MGLKFARGASGIANTFFSLNSEMLANFVFDQLRRRDNQLCLPRHQRQQQPRATNGPRFVRARMQQQ